MSLSIGRLTSGAALLIAMAAPAAAQTCRIPRELLCPGCAEKLTLTIQRSGRCVVTAAPQAASLASSRSDLVIRLVDDRNSLARTIRPRERVFAMTPLGAPRCFTFQERRYCE